MGFFNPFSHIETSNFTQQTLGQRFADTYAVFRARHNTFNLIKVIKDNISGIIQGDREAIEALGELLHFSLFAPLFLIPAIVLTLGVATAILLPAGIIYLLATRALQADSNAAQIALWSGAALLALPVLIAVLALVAAVVALSLVMDALAAIVTAVVSPFVLGTHLVCKVINLFTKGSSETAELEPVLPSGSSSTRLAASVLDADLSAPTNASQSSVPPVVQEQNGKLQDGGHDLAPSDEESPQLVLVTNW